MAIMLYVLNIIFNAMNSSAFHMGCFSSTPGGLVPSLVFHNIEGYTNGPKHDHLPAPSLYRVKTLLAARILSQLKLVGQILPH